MQRRDLSSNKLPRIAPSDTTLSSKLYSLTGLRIFQAKFMEELRYPRPQQKLMPALTPSNQNFAQTTPSKLVVDGFTGKDRGNERAQRARQVEPRARQDKKEEGALKLKGVERVRVLNGRPRGLRNLGNTCYINAILQSLLALEEFSSAVEGELKLKKQEKGLAVAYAKLVNVYRNCEEKQVVNPSDFKSLMGKRKDRFAGNAQQDAQQLLTAFLEGINEQMTRVKVKPIYKELQGDPTKDSIKNIANDWWSYSKKRDDSVVCDYFQGQMECTIVCSECKFKSVSFDNFWGLPVSFGLKGSSLADLIAANFCTEHRLEDYSCEKCKKAKTCSKTVKLFRLPIVLVVQLKRFGYGWSRKQKIKDKVAVPLQLSLKEVISSQNQEQESTYRLNSTVEHSGQLNYGHYTGHVYSQKEQRWFNANDEGVSQEAVETNAPQLYLLFYYKK